MNRNNNNQRDTVYLLNKRHQKVIERLKKKHAKEIKTLEKKTRKEVDRVVHRETRRWSAQIREEKKKRSSLNEDVWDFVKGGYKLKKIKTISSGKFGSYDEYKIKITSTPFDIEAAFKGILKKVINEYKLVEGDKIRMVINHENLNTPKSNKFQTIPKENVENFILEHNEEFLEFVSYKELSADEILVSVHWVKIPRGKGRSRPTKTNLYSKSSVIPNRNEDTLCLARSIVTAWCNKFKTKPSEQRQEFHLQKVLCKIQTLKTLHCVPI